MTQLMRKAEVDPATNPAVSATASICAVLPRSCFGTSGDNGPRQNPDVPTKPLVMPIAALMTMAIAHGKIRGCTHITNSGMKANRHSEAISNPLWLQSARIRGYVTKFLPICRGHTQSQIAKSKGMYESIH